MNLLTRCFLVAAFPATAIVSLLPIAAAAPAAPAAGQATFEHRCAACHSMEPGENDVGPSLAGVVGRKAGSVAGFDYSPALKAWGKVWTGPQLDQFLAGPQKMVPGTRMAMPVAEADQRQALIAYLAGTR